jgi:hypothetical protein
MEIAQRWKDGKCFHCDDLFTQGHKQICKHLFCTVVLGDKEEDRHPDDHAAQ